MEKDRNLLLYLFGSNTSIFGDVLLTTALALHIMSITQSPKAFANVLALAFIPRLVFSFFAGAIVDRINSKIVMIVLDLVRSLFLIICYLLDSISMNAIVILILSFAVIDTFFIPASITVVPKLFEKNKISKVNSLDQSVRSTVNVISPLIASIVFIMGGIKLVLLIDAITFLISAISEYMFNFRFQEEPNKSQKSLLFNIKDGLKVVFRDIRVKSLLINGALTHLFLFTFIEVGMISLLMITFKKPEYHYGILQGVISASAIVASILAMIYRKKRKISENINIGIIGMILSILLFIPLCFDSFRALISNFDYLPLIYLSFCCFVMFLSFGYYGIFFRSFYQSEVPQKYLGRFSSIFIILVSVSRMLGMYFYGQLFERELLTYAITILGIGMIIKLIVHIPFIKEEKRLELEI